VPTTVDGGVTAITELQSATKTGNPFQLILLDCMMPGMDGFSVAELVSGNPAFASPTIIMISSAVGLGDAARCREAGITHYMTKPVIKSELFDVIVDALGQEDTRTRNEAKSITLKAARPLNILAVEDDPINQRVAAGFLERAGHKVTIANTGKVAVSIIDDLANDADESFDLILMDLQMPEMDGLKTTAVIRERESDSENRVPIIAMTAAAMKGDRERCLAGGMDAYIAKPIAVEQLFKIIEEQTGIARQPSIEIEQETEDSTSFARLPIEMIDIAKLEAEFPGGPSGLKKTLTIFLTELPKLLSEIEAGLATSNESSVKRAAHTILGSAKILRIEKLAQISQKMEIHASSAEFDQCHSLYPQISEVSQEAIQEVSAYIGLDSAP
jgi:CheY-like chemotaxis protein